MQLFHRHYVSQSSTRHFSYKSHDRVFSSQVDDRDHTKLDNLLKSIQRKSKEERNNSSSLGNRWTITSVEQKQRLRHHLTNNTKYASTVYQSRINLQSIFQDYSGWNSGITQIVKNMNELFEKGQHKEAMDVFVPAAVKYSKWPEEALKPLERCLTSQIQGLGLTNTLYALDVFIQVDYKPSHLLAALLRHLSMQWESIEKTPPNIVHLLYFIGLSRDAPDELWHYIEKYLEENVTEISSVDICIICFAFASADVPIQSSTLTQAMAKTICNEWTTSLQNQSKFYLDMNDSTNIFKGFHISNYDNVRFYEELGDIICETSLSDQAIRYSHLLMIIARTYATMGIKHDRLFKKIAEKIPASRMQAYGSRKLQRKRTTRKGTVLYRRKDLMHLCWSYAQLRMKVPRHWKEALVDALNVMSVER